MCNVLHPFSNQISSKSKLLWKFPVGVYEKSKDYPYPKWEFKINEIVLS
jgi:hypothetical protein